MTKTVENRWEQPEPVMNVDIAFGGDMERLLPSWEELSEEFKRDRSPYCKVADNWFFSGLDKSKLKPKDGIDSNVALRHCAAIMVSWQPKHEHKIGGVGYLLSLWFDLA